jgi:hypothetical protein
MRQCGDCQLCFKVLPVADGENVILNGKVTRSVAQRITSLAQAAY